MQFYRFPEAIHLNSVRLSVIQSEQVLAAKRRLACGSTWISIFPEMPIKGIFIIILSNSNIPPPSFVCRSCLTCPILTVSHPNPPGHLCGNMGRKAVNPISGVCWDGGEEKGDGINGPTTWSMRNRCRYPSLFIVPRNFPRKCGIYSPTACQPKSFIIFLFVLFWFYIPRARGQAVLLQYPWLCQHHLN